MLEGKIMGRRAHDVETYINEKIQLLVDKRLGRQIKEELYEDETLTCEDLEKAVEKGEAEVIPVERQRPPTQLEVCHYFAAEMKKVANGLLKMREWTEKSPTDVMRLMQYISKQCYLYNHALVQKRAREFMVTDKDNPSNLKMRGEMGFIKTHLEIHEQMWAYVPNPNNVDQAAHRPRTPKQRRLSKKEEREQKRKIAEMQAKEKEAMEAEEKRRGALKEKRFAKKGLPLYDAPTDEKKRTLMDKAVDKAKEMVQERGADEPAEGQARVRVPPSEEGSKSG